MNKLTFKHLPIKYRRKLIEWRKQVKKGLLDPEIMLAFSKLGIEYLLDTQPLHSKNKKQIIEMATSGLPKPNPKTYLGSFLAETASVKKRIYDPNFIKTLRNIRPDWFRENRTIESKNKLLDLARSGAKRPDRRSTENYALANYTCKNKKGYDPDFTKQIAEIRPDWFAEANTEKQKLEIIALAQSGSVRPSKDLKIGRLLPNYVNKNSKSYDENFTNNLKTLRPDWFRS